MDELEEHKIETWRGTIYTIILTLYLFWICCDLVGWHEWQTCECTKICSCELFR